MKITCLLVSLLLLTSCGSKAPIRLVETTYDESGQERQVVYSPYMELEHYSDDKAVLARLVISLGPERVPDGYQHSGTFAKDLSRSYRDGIVEWVSELYLINKSEEPIDVELISVTSDGKSKQFGTVFQIEPQKWAISDPVIELDSSYGIRAEVEFSYSYAGKTYDVKGNAERLTVDEVRAKYSR